VNITDFCFPTGLSLKPFSGLRFDETRCVETYALGLSG